MSLIKAMATVGGLTGLSRLAGFARDILTASILGAGPVADAFFVALKLPNLFRRVTAEGAFSVSFVPLYSEMLQKTGEEKADEFAGNALSIMAIVLSVFSAIVMLAMPLVMYVIAPGFTDDPLRYPLAVEMTRITFPYLLLMSMTALLGGVMNAHDKFAPFAIAPVLFNLTMIVFLLCSEFGFETPGHALAWGVFASGFLQCGVLWICIKRTKIPVTFRRPRFDAKIKKLLNLMGPGAIGAGVMHINLFADMIIASLLPTGSISYLYYADRLNQLPLGMVGIAVGTALLPMLSRAMAAGNGEKSNHLFNRALEICFFLALPAATGLFIASYPIVAALFEHGEFTHKDVIMTTAVLTAYALGMPAYVAVKVYSTAFWAKQDTVTPVKVAVACTLFNIGMALFLIYAGKAGVIGIAVATAMAGWLQIALMGRLLKRRGDLRFDAKLKANFIKIVTSCAAMAAYLYVMKAFISDWYLGEAVTHTGQILAVIVLVAGGAAVYAAGVTLTGVVKIGDLHRFFRPDAKII